MDITSQDEIDSRIISLEKEKVISRYTISMDSTKVKRRIIRVALVRFKVSQHLLRRLEGLKKYLTEAPFVCIFYRAHYSLSFELEFLNLIASSIIL